MTFAGVPEIRPDWVARHMDELFVLDVRSPGEFEGELGHLQGAHLIPLDELRELWGGLGLVEREQQTNGAYANPPEAVDGDRDAVA